MLWRHVRADDGHCRASTDSCLSVLCGGGNVARSSVRERKFVAKFTSAVSSDSTLIAAVWNGAGVEA